MAQAGYTPILIYASGTATNIPTSGNLISGSSGAELAINYADGKLYYKDGSGNVKLLSIGYGSSSVTPTNGGVQYGTGTALALTAAGSSGQILRSNGAAAPTWADLSTLGVNTISFGTTGLTPNSATAGAVTVAGTLVTANGGTGLGGATPFTANGVLYASSASALTSGSALTFDGTKLTVKGGNAGQLVLDNANEQYVQQVFQRNATLNSGADLLLDGSGNTFNFRTLAAGMPFVWQISASAGSPTEQMRLTSTGLGIGTSSPSDVLTLAGGASGSYGLTINNSKVGGGTKAIFQYDATNAIALVGGNTTNGLAFQTLTSGNLTTKATLDSSGNLGLGVTPSGWSNRKAFEGLYGGALSFDGVFLQTAVSSNCYYNGTNWIYKLTNWGATRYETGDVSNGAPFHKWYVAASGTAGNAITFTQALTLDASGNLLLGGTSAGASSAASLAIFNGTAPTGSVTNGIILYAEDVSSSSELKVRDEAGNVTTLSPHNFSLIPDGPSEDMAWAYYSEKGGKRINVDMLKLARMVEKLTGEKLVYES